MAYSIQLQPERVRAYLRDYAGLSRASRLRLWTTLLGELTTHGDAYRADPARRSAVGSPIFWFNVVIPDDTGELLVFRFAVNDAAASFGVLQVVYVDSRPWNPAPPLS